MSWLVSNWYGVLALFATPAVLGVAFWVIAHRMIGERERHDRARDARKLGAFQLTRRTRRR
jgi:cyanate permease